MMEFITVNNTGYPKQKRRRVSKKRIRIADEKTIEERIKNIDKRIKRSNCHNIKRRSIVMKSVIIEDSYKEEKYKGLISARQRIQARMKRCGITGADMMKIIKEIQNGEE